MFKKIMSLFLSFSLIITQPIFAQGLAQLDLAQYLGKSAALGAENFRPVQLRYVSYNMANNAFKLLLDKGDNVNPKIEKPKNQKILESINSPNSQIPELNATAQELFNYFLIGLALPNDTFWVNLRPDSPDNIIDPELEKTDLGRILLEADLQLKKDTASLTSPQTAEGKAYWDKLYKKAGELFGTENITIPTITRPWIVPGEIIVRESGNSAYIYKANLKVMLEADYLSSFQPSAVSHQQYSFSDPRLKELNEYSSRIIRETIIPKLTQEVNSAKRYAKLRQVYYSLVLSRWFKQKYSSPRSIRAPEHQSAGMDYVGMIDSGNLANLSAKEPYDKLTYFKQYQESFAKGEYNLKEPVYTPYGQSIRTYMSGGFFAGKGAIKFSGVERTVGSPIVEESFKNHNTVALEISGDRIKLVDNQEQPKSLAASPVVLSREFDDFSRKISASYEHAFIVGRITHREYEIIKESFGYNPMLAAYKLGGVIKNKLRNNQMNDFTPPYPGKYEFSDEKKVDEWLGSLTVNDIDKIKKSIDSILAGILSISPQRSSLWLDVDAVNEQMKKSPTIPRDYVSLIGFLNGVIAIIKKGLSYSEINRGYSNDDLEKAESELKKILSVALTEAIISKIYNTQKFTKQILAETDLYVNDFKSVISRIEGYMTDYEYSILSLALKNLPAQRKDYMIFNPGVVPAGNLLMLELQKSRSELASELQAVKDAGADLTSSRIRFIHNRPCRILLGALADMLDNIDKTIKGYNILVDAGDNFDSSIDALMDSSRSLHDAFYLVRGYLNYIFIKRFSNLNGIKLEVLKDSYELYGGDGLFLSAEEVFHRLPKRYQDLYYALYNSSVALKKYEDRCKILRNTWDKYRTGPITAASPVTTYLINDTDRKRIGRILGIINMFTRKDAQGLIYYPLYSAESGDLKILYKQIKEELRIYRETNATYDIQKASDAVWEFYATLLGLQTQKTHIPKDMTGVAAEVESKSRILQETREIVANIIKDMKTLLNTDMTRFEEMKMNGNKGFDELEDFEDAVNNLELRNLKTLAKQLGDLFNKLKPEGYKEYERKWYAISKELEIFDYPDGGSPMGYPSYNRRADKYGGVSSSLQTIQKPQGQLGGIDFTEQAMRIGIERMGSFASSALVMPEIADAAAIDLDKEFKQIQMMASSGIRPSDTRILEFEAACYYRGEFSQRLGEITACIQQAHFLDERLGRESSEALRLATVLPEVL